MDPNSSTPAIDFGTESLAWVVAEGHTTKYPYQLRFCKIPVSFPRSKYPVRVNIFWSMASPRQDGLASPEDIQRMHAFEERIVSATENKKIAMLPLVLTGNRQREFVFFARSSEEFLEALRHIPQEDARYPIEIHQSEDASWTYYENEIGAIK
jgi:hypothetical protein